MVYLVTYDLRKPGKDYASLYEAIKSLGAWWHYLESTWLVESNSGATTIAKQLRPHIDDNDSFLVIRVDRDYSGWLPQEAWDWIASRV